MAVPANNLRLLQNLVKYHDAKISATCLNAFGSHQSYISEGFFSLALFDPQVNATVKTSTVLVIFETEATKDSPKRATLPVASSIFK